jgi:mannose-6-phosphate isomerase-like protein (cupin superfamily)
MESKPPTIIDLNAEVAKLTMFRGLTPQTTFAERRGSGSLLGPYRDGILFAGKFAGTSHWEDHAEDELVHILDGTKTLDIVCDDGAPKSFVLHAGMMAIVPKGTWHRFRSSEGGTTMSATLPGEHIESDVDDPRTAEPQRVMPSGTPGIIDLNAELAKLTLFRGRTPRTTNAERQGSSARLAAYRDGGLSITKFTGKGHWEAHLAGDELIHIIDGTATLEIVCDDGPPKSFALSAGMIAVNPQGVWHRFQSSEGVTLMAATPFRGEMIEDDVDDPRTVENQVVKV